MNSLPITQNAVRQSASPNTAKIRSATGRNTAASGRGGRITRQRWNIVDQSSSVRVTPLLVADLQHRIRVARHHSSVTRCGAGYLRRGRSLPGERAPHALRVPAVWVGSVRSRGSGESVSFASNGTAGQGYLSTPESGSGPGVVVLQEWWGLNDQIKEVCDRFAREGSSRSRPTSTGATSTREPDEAGKMMMALNIEQAAKDMVGAVDYLAAPRSGHVVRRRRDRVLHGRRLGPVAGNVAARRGRRRGAVLRGDPVGGRPARLLEDAAAVQGHYAENDDFAGAPAVAALEEQLSAAGKEYRVLPVPRLRPCVHEPPPSRGLPRRALRAGLGADDRASSAPASDVIHLADQAKPIARSIAAGISSSPRRAASARSTLIASRRRARATCPTGRAGSRAVAVGVDARGAGRPAARATSALAADRSVPGDDHVGEVGDRVEHVGPRRRVALERERRDAEEAQVAGEAARRRRRRARSGRPRCGRSAGSTSTRGVSCAAPVTRCVTAARAELGEVVELLVERGHERLVRVDGHRAVEHVARLR